MAPTVAEMSCDEKFQAGFVTHLVFNSGILDMCVCMHAHMPKSCVCKKEEKQGCWRWGIAVRLYFMSVYSSQGIKNARLEQGNVSVIVYTLW